MTWHRLATILGVAAVLALAAPVVNAGDPTGTDTGASAATDPGLTPQEQALADRKDKLAQDYLLVRLGKLDPAVFAKEWVASMGTGATMPTGALPDGPEPMPILDVIQVAQSNDHYCGPASAFEILRYLGVTSGPANESLTQLHLARHCSAGYLCTDALGETPWYNSGSYPRPMLSTLNAWLGTSSYVVVIGSDHYVSHLLMDIDSHLPLGMDVHERKSATTPHLVGHPTNVVIAHWIAVHGYDENGAWSYYADSVHGVSTNVIRWAASVPAHSWISSGSDGLSYMMDDSQDFRRGHIW